MPNGGKKLSLTVPSQVAWYCIKNLKKHLWHFSGISHDDIAQESKRYWQNLEANVPGAQVYFSFVLSAFGIFSGMA